MEQTPTARIDRACPICGSRERQLAFTTHDHLVSHQTFQVQRCALCDCHYTSPCPSADHIGAFYRSEAYISHTDRNQGLLERVYHQVRKVNLRVKLRQLASFRTSGNLLDFGCGTGAFAAAAQAAGFQVSAVEPGNDARRIASQHPGLRIAASLEDLPTSPAFHIVTMWHVLEHLHSPADTLLHLHKRMEDDAWLIIAVPDRSSWDAGHYGPQWAAWDTPRHLTHFTRDNMARLLTKCHFRLVGTHAMWFDAPYVSILSERNSGRSPITAFSVGLLKGLWSNIVAFFTKRASSSTLYVAKKTASQ